MTKNALVVLALVSVGVSASPVEAQKLGDGCALLQALQEPGSPSPGTRSHGQPRQQRLRPGIVALDLLASEKVSWLVSGVGAGWEIAHSAIEITHRAGSGHRPCNWRNSGEDRDVRFELVGTFEQVETIAAGPGRQDSIVPSKDVRSRPLADAQRRRYRPTPKRPASSG
jgi:hypothetical protein